MSNRKITSTMIIVFSVSGLAVFFMNFKDETPIALTSPARSAPAYATAVPPSGARSPASTANQPPEDPPEMKSLVRVMKDLQSAMESESKAATVLEEYENCLKHPEDQNFHTVIGVCAQNAQAIGDKYPALKDRATAIVALKTSTTDVPAEFAPGLSTDASSETK